VVFTRTKHGADRVMKRLLRAKVDAAAIHGNKNQNQRQRALDAFKAGKIRVLVATDVAARGIDVDDVTHVINYDIPVEPESYVHRIGRTGRAGATGIAIAFCEPAERGALKQIEKLIGKAVPVKAAPQDLAVLSQIEPASAGGGRREHPAGARGGQRGGAQSAKPAKGKGPAHGRGGAHAKAAKARPAGTTAPAAAVKTAHPAAPAAHPRAHQLPSARTPSRRGRR
jgi:ATP-dependent RNA helicase RhlE